MANGCPPDDALQALVQGRLAPEEAAELVTHVSGCEACTARSQSAAEEQTTQRDSPKAPSREGRRGLEPQRPELPGDAIGMLETLRRAPSGDGEGSAAGRPRGSFIGRYVILDRIGAGGMSVVYAAFDPDLERKVAIKLLKGDGTEPGGSQELRLRLLREAQAMARLSHPHVVTVHDVGLVDDEVFIAMEHVEGVTLTRWLKDRPRTWRQKLDVFLKAGQGLAAAHALGLVHRDFKPENVLVNQDGRVRVMDFGLVHAAHETRPQEALASDPSLATASEHGPMRRRITQPGTLLGTPAYMSPEQLVGRPTDARSDQFSFAVALYEALYGERPFAGETAPAVLAEIEAGRVRSEPLATPVPRRLRRLLVRSLSARPDDRFRTMDGLLNGLSRRRNTFRRQWVLPTVSLTVVASLALGAWAWRERTYAPCERIPDRLRGVWDGRVKRDVRTLFVGSGVPYAEKTFSEVERALDGYADRWVALRKAACEEQSSDEAVGARIICLGQRYTEFQALTQLYLHADPEVIERAVPAALALPSLERCSNPVPRAVAPAVDKSQAEEIRVLLAAAKARLDAGKFAEGLAEARTALDRARALGARGLEAEALFLMAGLTSKQGDVRRAAELHLDAIVAAEAAGDTMLAARAWIERLGLNGTLARFDDGHRDAQHAQAMLERMGGDDELSASLYNNLGVLAWAQGRHEEAISHHERALSLRERLLGPSHPLVARSLSNIGISLKAQGKLDQALSYYRRAETIEEASLAPDHPAVGETLNNLGNLLHEKGQSDDALAYLQRALAIKERAYGTEHRTVAVTLNNLATVLATMDRLEEALDTQQRALRIKEATLGPDHPSVAASLTNLGAIYFQLKQHDRALELYRRALAIREKSGLRQPEIATDLTAIGRCLLALGRPAEAVAPLERALDLRDQTPVDPLVRAETRLALAHALAEGRSDTLRAATLARQARDAYERQGERGKAQRDDAEALRRKLTGIGR